MTGPEQLTIDGQPAQPVETPEYGNRVTRQIYVGSRRYAILCQLKKTPAGLTIPELRERMVLCKSQLVLLIDNLITEGYVERAARMHSMQPMENARYWLTQKGREHVR